MFDNTFSWIDPLMLDKDKIRQWEKESIVKNIALIEWLLIHNVVDEEIYFKWATAKYKVERIQDEEFYRSFDLSFFKKVKDLYSWRPLFFPFGHKKGNLLIASVEPTNNLDIFCNYECFLCSSMAMLQIWKDNNIDDYIPLMFELYLSKHNINENERNSAIGYMPNKEEHISPLLKLKQIDTFLTSIPQIPTLLNRQSPSLPLPLPLPPPPPIAKQYADTANTAPSIVQEPFVQDVAQEKPIVSMKEPLLKMITSKITDMFTTHSEGKNNEKKSVKSIKSLDAPQGLNLGSLQLFSDTSLTNVTNITNVTNVPSAAAPNIFSLNQNENLVKQEKTTGSYKETFSMPEGITFNVSDQSKKSNEKNELNNNQLSDAIEKLNETAEKKVALLKKPILCKFGEIAILQELLDKEDIVNKTFELTKKFYDQTMIFLFENQNLCPWRWNDMWYPKVPDGDFSIELKTPGIFKIVHSTKLPYHGYVVASDANNKFFASWNEDRLPNNINLSFLKYEDTQIGMILVATDKNIEQKISLEYMTELSENLSFALINSEKSLKRV